MRFYAVSTEAVDLTYRALQQLDRGRKGRVVPVVLCVWPRSLGTCNAVLEVEPPFRWVAVNWRRPGICTHEKSGPIC